MFIWDQDHQSQKLGAKAVITINNEEAPLSRMMASKDEVALIKIPAVMVTKRFLYALEHEITPHYQYHQYLVALQPSSHLNDYDTQ